jgi:Secretion system C-terminal sorting domain
MKKISFCRSYFLAALLMLMINSLMIGQNCTTQNVVLSINSNTTWTGTQFYNRPISITSGNTLTINNATIQFANECWIYIESGASIVVNNSILTNNCGGRWHGIQGDGSLNLNTATLEHAYIAVRRAGGLFTSQNCLFENNVYDFIYENKPASPTNVHTNATFRVTNDYRGTELSPRVYLYNSRDVNFFGCHFDNQHTNPLSLSSLSSDPGLGWLGIRAVQSVFVTEQSSLRKTRFNRFHTGIRMSNWGQGGAPGIYNSIFENNFVGIFSDNVNAFKVEDNKFFVNWGGNSFPSSDWYKTGLVINTGTGFFVQNNDFQGNLTGNGSGQYTFGTLVIRTGADENRIRGNKNNKLYVGHRILGNNTNADPDFPSGLELWCTNNSENIYDQTIEADGDFNGGIRPVQGRSGAPEGNIFSNNANGVPEIWSDGVPFVRWYQQNTNPNFWASSTVGLITQSFTTGNLICTPHIPFLREPTNNITGITLAKESLVGSSDGTSASTVNSNGLAENLTSIELSALEDEFEEADAALQAAKKQYDELIDGGNQGQLLSNVRTRWNRDTAALRRNLLALSPNLSTQVLIATAELNVLSKASLMTLLQANPSACRSNKLKKVLTQELRTPFSDAEFQSLLTVSSRGSRRFEIEDAINTHSSRKGDIGNALISGLITDPEGNKEKLRYWWGRIGTRHAQYSLAESYIKENESNRYEAQLRNLSRNLTDFEVQRKENDDYVALYGIKSKVLKSGRKWQQMTASEIEQVRRIANNTRGDAAVQANNILCYAFGECQPLVIPFLPNEHGMSVLRAQTPHISKPTPSASPFVAYPNPTHTTISVDYNLTDKFENAYISLFDFTGREIKRQKLVASQSQVQWQTSDMQAGIYLISIHADNRLVWQTKVSVQK